MIRPDKILNQILKTLDRGISEKQHKMVIEILVKFEALVRDSQIQEDAKSFEQLIELFRREERNQVHSDFKEIKKAVGA